MSRIIRRAKSGVSSSRSRVPYAALAQPLTDEAPPRQPNYRPPAQLPGALLTIWPGYRLALCPPGPCPAPRPPAGCGGAPGWLAPVGAVPLLRASVCALGVGSPGGSAPGSGLGPPSAGVRGTPPASAACGPPPRVPPLARPLPRSAAAPAGCPGRSGFARRAVCAAAALRSSRGRRSLCAAPLRSLPATGPWSPRWRRPGALRVSAPSGVACGPCAKPTPLPLPPSLARFAGRHSAGPCGPRVALPLLRGGAVRRPAGGVPGWRVSPPRGWGSAACGPRVPRLRARAACLRALSKLTLASAGRGLTRRGRCDIIARARAHLTIVSYCGDFVPPGGSRKPGLDKTA